LYYAGCAGTGQEVGAVKKFGRAKSSASSIARAERDRDWIELRRQGLLESEIASRYEVRQQTVSKAILKYVRNLPALAADDLRRIEAERLDALYAALAPAIAKGDPRSIEAAVRISERRAKLLGLDAPNTHRITGPDNWPVQIMNLLAHEPPIDIEMIKRIQDLEPIVKPAGADDYNVDEDLLSITDSSSDEDGSSTTDAVSELEPYSLKRTEDDARRGSSRGFIRVR
jgi:hypothetical protein